MWPNMGVAWWTHGVMSETHSYSFVSFKLFCRLLLEMLTHFVSYYFKMLLGLSKKMFRSSQNREENSMHIRGHLCYWRTTMWCKETSRIGKYRQRDCHNLVKSIALQCFHKYGSVSGRTHLLPLIARVPSQQTFRQPISKHKTGWQTVSHWGQY